MAAVLERAANPQASELVRKGIARMQAAQRFFTEEEWKALASIEGQVVSGNPDGRLPDDLEADDNE